MTIHVQMSHNKSRDRNEDCTMVGMRVANPYYVYYLWFYQGFIMYIKGSLIDLQCINLNCFISVHDCSIRVSCSTMYRNSTSPMFPLCYSCNLIKEDFHVFYTVIYKLL